MFSESIIDVASLQAYRDTEYRVHAKEPFTLRIGRVSAALVAAHKRCRTDCSAFIMASNSFGQALDDATNDKRHADLGRELDLRSLMLVPTQN